MSPVDKAFVSQLLLMTVLFLGAVVIGFVPGVLPSIYFEEPVTAVLELAFLFFILTVIGSISALMRPEQAPQPGPDEDETFFALKLQIAYDMLGNTGTSAVIVSLALLIRYAGYSAEATLTSVILLMCSVGLTTVGYLQHARYVRTQREEAA